jgi:hypothetical protein
MAQGGPSADDIKASYADWGKQLFKHCAMLVGWHAVMQDYLAVHPNAATAKAAMEMGLQVSATVQATTNIHKDAGDIDALGMVAFVRFGGLPCKGCVVGQR